MIKWIILVVAAVLIIVICEMLIKCYNNLIALKNRVENQAAQIDVQIKRRADLIPKLVETTREYASYEKETLQQVIGLRNHVLESGSLDASYQADRELGQAVQRLFAIGEQYPELKANTNFLKLQDEMSDTEDKISKARQFYNDTVAKYNTAIMTFPQSLIAGCMHFHKIDLTIIVVFVLLYF